MKKLLLAGLLITTLLLILLSGCKPAGKAIALPNVTATNIANFPYQFMTSTGTTVGYSRVTVFASTGYNTVTTDLLNFMRLKACQLAANQGYNCVDSQGSPIPTTAAVLGLTGMSVAGDYYCNIDSNICIDRESQTTEFSKDYGVKGVLEGSAAGAGFSAVDICINSTTLKEWYCDISNCARTYEDYPCPSGQVCQDGACIATTTPTQPTPTQNTTTGQVPNATAQNSATLYRCYNTATHDHMPAISCPEGYNREHALGIIYTNESDYAVVLITRPLFLCKAVSNPNDQFVSQDSACEGKIILGPIGRFFMEDQPGFTDPIYRCYNEDANEHMMSLDPNCEGWGTGARERTWYILKASGVTTPPTQQPTAECDADSDNGDDPYTAGTVSSQGSTVATDQCSTDGKMLEEYYCSNGNIVKKEYLAYAYPVTACQNGALNARPVWQCVQGSIWQGDEEIQHNSDTLVTFDPNRCGGTPFGLIYTSQVTDTIPIYDCHQKYKREWKDAWGRVTRYFYHDLYLSLASNCEHTQAQDDAGIEITVNGILGYLPSSEMPYITRTIYRYWKGGAPTFDHILSANPNEPNTESRETAFNFIAPCIDTDRINSDLDPKFVKGDISAIGSDGAQYIAKDACISGSNKLVEYSCDFSSPQNYPQNYVSTEITCPSGTSCSEGKCTTTPGAPGTACTNNSDCNSGLYCLFNICMEKMPLYNCYLASRDEYYPSRSSECRHPITNEQGTGVLIGYTTEDSFPDTARWGLCIDTTTHSIPTFYPSREGNCPSGQTFQYVSQLYTRQRPGTTELYARQGPPVQLIPIGTVDYKYYYTTNPADDGPENYTRGHSPGYVIPLEPALGCGNGIVNPPEECDDGNLNDNDGCDHNCMLEHPANATNVTNYTYIPPTTGPIPTPPITLTGNYIAIGTCTDNAIIASTAYGLGSTVCTNLLPGEAIIYLKQVGAITGLIIAGGSPADIAPAIQVLKNLTKWNADGSILDITSSQYLTTVGRLVPGVGPVYRMEYTLPAGIHFIGVPFTLASKNIANIPSLNANGIFVYDAANNRSVKFDVNWPSRPALSDLSAFGNEREAYYVKADTARTFMLPDATLLGGSTSMRNAPAGWVAYTPYGKQKTLSQIVPTGVVVNALWCYENNQFVQKNLAQNPTIFAGQGCWINLASGTTLS